MFDWLGSVLSGIGDAFESIGDSIVEKIWDSLIQWIYKTIYDAVAALFAIMGNMGAEIFDLVWVQATVKLFTLLGWSLFVVGVVVAIFDVAIEYQTGRANIKTTAINILKGFFACSLIGVAPIELYRLCITLQHLFMRDIGSLVATSHNSSLIGTTAHVFTTQFLVPHVTTPLALLLFILIAFVYCVIKIFFANIKRGGILLIQIAVGSLYMFSVPRGYQDGFNQWMKQVIAICLTAFLQTSLLYIGLLTFSGNMILGLGIMLAANEVPRIAQQFGLDSSVKFNAMSAIYATSSVVNLTRTITKAVGK